MPDPTDSDFRDQPRRPAAEPEIIPPDHPGPQRTGDRRTTWTVDEAGRSYRIFVAKPSPFAMVLALIGLGAALAIVIFLVLGLFLLWVPVLGIVLCGLVLSALLRGPPRRLP